LLDGERTVELPGAGAYRVSVQGVGQGDDPAFGWTAYGSLGSYSLSASVSSVAPIDRCLVVRSGSGGGGGKNRKTTHCFDAADLTTLPDGGDGARRDVVSCRVVGGGGGADSSKRSTCTVNQTKNRLCVSLQRDQQHRGGGGGTESGWGVRTVRAVVRGTSSPGQGGGAVDVETTVKVYWRRPPKGSECEVV
jgi:hypothetical protein